MEDALGIAKSHLVSDYFFSSSFVGQMPWNNGVLILNNEGSLIGQYSKNDLNNILNDISSAAADVNEKQYENGILQVIETVQNSY
ncbi:Hypothetical protein ORPV_383 [Orpheovirus IHUMI-LCC2]|uniref:Uncharacterized protein n=1 Tax=Orpheovirus IHUMI-LCC2 TaxID=2023057 RepID=A0A2I2L440_9VIRU|nr:Hypothetical protein ORPV_383 [Orpheovirus IHUMI-LCC2]SNW62287.1 Hypothetical protein ORPV_383 [Orpheovirus IHUMI-LCC2]